MAIKSSFVQKTDIHIPVAFLKPSKLEIKQANASKKFTEKAKNIGLDEVNTYTGKELQQQLSDVVDQRLYGNAEEGYYQQVPDGTNQDGTTKFKMVPYNKFNKYGTHDTRDLYIDTTEQGNYKLGLARTDQGGYVGRYDTSLHPNWDRAANGELAGALGVTPEDGSLMNITLPKNIADQFEFNTHSNKGQIENRSAGITIDEIEKNRPAFGSGVSEYTNPNAPMWNQDTEISENQLPEDTYLPKDIKSPYDKRIAELRRKIGNEGRIEETIDVAQSAAADLFNNFEMATRNVKKYLIDKLGDGSAKKALTSLSKLTEIDEIPFSDMKVSDKNTQADFDKEFGVSIETRQNFNKDMKKSEQQWVNGNYWDATVTAAKNFDRLIAQSAPGMGAIATGYIGIPLFALAETQNQNEEFKHNNNGESMTEKELAAAYATRVGLLIPERLLLIFGMKGFLSGLMGKGGKLRAASITTAGEGFQEYGEAIQETYFTQKRNDKTLTEIATAPETVHKGMVGSLMAGGMTGVGATAGGARDVAGKVLAKGYEANIKKTADLKRKEALDRKLRHDYQTFENEIDPDDELKDVKITGMHDGLKGTKKATNDFDNDQKATYKEFYDKGVAKREEREVSMKKQEEELNKTDSEKATEELKALRKKLEELGEDPAAATDVYVHQQVKKKVEDGTMTKEEGEEYRDALTQRLQRAGLTSKDGSKVLLESLQEGMDIELVEDEKVSLKTNKKNQRLEPHDIGDSIIGDIVSGAFDIKNFITKLFSKNDTKTIERTNKALQAGSEAQEKLGEIVNGKDGIKDTLEKSTVLDGIVDKKNEDAVNKATRIVALTLDGIEPGITSEFDLNEKAELPHRKNATARVQGLAQQLGKNLMNSYGVKLSGDAQQIGTKYEEIGLKMIAFTEETGMVKTQNEFVSAPNVVDKKTGLFPKRFKKKSQKKTNTSNREITLLEEKTVGLTDVEGSGSVRVVHSENASAMKALARILKATNYSLPTQDATLNPIVTDGKIGPKFEEIVKQYRELEYSIKPEFVKLFKEIHKSIYGFDGKKDFDKALAENKNLQRLLGLQNTNSWFMKNSEAGRNRDRKEHLREIINNIDYLTDDIGNKFHFDYKVAINKRIHVMQTILDFQGDKFIARQVLTGGEYTTENQNQANVLIAAISDKLDLSKEEILEPTGWLEKTLGQMKNGYLTLSQLNQAITSHNTKAKSGFELLSILRAAKDIADSNGKNITSNYMIEFDASASGVVNTLLNLSGMKEVQAVLDKMGVRHGEKSSDSIDPYSLLMDQATLAMNGDEKLKAYVDELKKANIDERELAKYTVMTWIYGSKNESVSHRMANSIVEELMTKAIVQNNQEAVDIINNMLGTNYVIDVSSETDTKKAIYDISENDIEVLVKKYQENVADKYAMQLTEAYPGIQEYKNIVGELFTLLKATGQWDGTFGTAIDKMLPGNGRHDMSIKKERQYYADGKNLDGTENPESLVLNDMFINENSMGVNPQHSSDSALAILALQMAMSIDPKSGIMSVHDSVATNSKMGLAIKENYDENSIKLALAYDFINEGLIQAQESIDKMEKGSARNQRQAKHDDIKKLNDERMANKKEYLKDASINVFGSEFEKFLKAERKTQAKPEPTVDPETLTFSTLINQVQNAFNKKKNKLKDKKEALVALFEKMEVSKDHKALLEKVIAAFDGDIKIEIGKHYEGGLGVVQIAQDILVDPRKTDGDQSVTADRLVEILAHEIDHAIQLAYIAENMKSPEIKYIQKIINKLRTKDLNKLSSEIRTRIEHIIADKKGEDYLNIAEFSAIMKNEAETRKAIQGLVHDTTIIEKIEKMIVKIIEWITGKTDEEINSYFSKGKDNFTKTMKAVEVLNHRAIIYGTKMKTDQTIQKGDLAKKMNNEKQEDIYRDAYMHPGKYASLLIERQNSYIAGVIGLLGGTAYDVISPLVREGHIKARRYSGRKGIYTKTVNLIRTGFSDSEFAQKMEQVLGIAGDVDLETMSKVMHLGTSIAQESGDLLTKELPKLHHRIEKLYPEKADQEKIYEIFSNTGISGLQYDMNVQNDLFHGIKTIKELIKRVEKNMVDEDIEVVKDVANYLTTGETETGNRNVEMVDLNSNNAKVLVALYALNEIKGAQNTLAQMNKKLRNDIMIITHSIEAQNREINLYGKSTTTRDPEKDRSVSIDFDGNYMQDIYERHEFKSVTKHQMKSSRYSEDKGWFLLVEPHKNVNGVIARKLQNTSTTPGMGLNQNRFSNGISLSTEENDKIYKMYYSLNGKPDQQKALLKENGLIKENDRFVLLLPKTAKEKLGLKKELATSLYRTFTHNKELIETRTIREMILEKAIKKIDDETAMEKLNYKIAENQRKSLSEKMKLSDEDRIIPMFLKIDYDFGTYDQLPKWIKNKYKTAEGISTFNDFNKKITLVRKSLNDPLLGHKNSTIFSEDSRTFGQWERVFKELIVMSKQHMIMTDVVKLTTDLVSNLGILGVLDVGPFETLKGFKEGWKQYHSFSRLRGMLVQAKLEMSFGKKNSEAKVKALEEKIKKHGFYDAFQAGFVQSYSTDLIVKEFDTLGGLQNDINTLVSSITKDEDGTANKVHDAIVWWMNFGEKNGFTVDHLLSWATIAAEKENTLVGRKVIEIADRLKDTRDRKDVEMYISEIVGSPSSHAVAIGGGWMVLADALSKYTLAKDLMKRTNPVTEKQYTKKEAYDKANKTFIDYRENLPSEIKTLSDYGVLMFPNFWLKIQRVIYGMIKYHPSTAIGGYLIADLLEMNNANILDTNLLNKIDEGSVLNNPMRIIDEETFFPFL